MPHPLTRQCRQAPSTNSYALPMNPRDSLVKVFFPSNLLNLKAVQRWVN